MNKEPFKTGMIFRSETHPQFDLIIDFVYYQRGYATSYDRSLFSMICWANINREAFDKFIKEKLGSNKKNTFPYPFAGECKINSMKQRIKKYNLKYVGMSDDKIKVYNDNKFEYSSGFADKRSKLTR